MDQQSAKRKRETSHIRKEASSSSSKKPKNTITSGETSFVIDASNFSEYLATMPTPRPPPLPQRRSLRLSKYNGRYRVALSPLPPLPLELMRYLVPPEGSITERERQETKERFNSLPIVSNPLDGFHLSAEEIAAYEASRNVFLSPPPLPSDEDIAQLVNKYTEAGLDRETVELAVPLYLDSWTEVKKFVDGFTTLWDMGFSKSEIGEALITCDRDADQALAYLHKKSC